MQFQQQGKKNLDKFFDKSVINKLGAISGFVQRKAKRISPYHFVLGFLISCSKKRSTFREWAIQISLLSGSSVSRQGVFDRIGAEATAFSKQLLEKALLAKAATGFCSELFSSFGKVLLHDSTTLRLPQSLSGVFAGNHSRGEQRAVARIQSIINLKAMKFLEFTLGSFTQNDQSASDSILPWAAKGDLVIRDMGYFVLRTFEKLIANEAHFLSRLRYGVVLYDKQGHHITFQSLMKGGRKIDRWVYIGSRKKIAVRLIMLPVTAGQKAQKVRRARQDRDWRVNHSREYYQWLGYSVYITTVDKDVWTAVEAARAYHVRWQIEILFKSWKSGFHLQAILHERYSNEHRVKVSIYLLLLFLCLFMQNIYTRYRNNIERRMGKTLSLLKLSVFINNNFKEIFDLSPKSLMELIAQHCCYEKRNNRINMTELYQNLKN